ncbi:MAG: hypothetical protein MUE49_03620 [Rhodospirillales bacterium]|nr:hypothetical protein [Rhodospirillales bacterium]
MVPHSAANLVGSVGFANFEITDAGLTQSLLLHRVPARRVALVVAPALVFNGEDGPTVRVNNQHVDALAIDRTKRIVLWRFKDLTEACLRK